MSNPDLKHHVYTLQFHFSCSCLISYLKLNCAAVSSQSPSMLMFLLAFYFPKPASIKRKLEKSINMSSWWQSALESGGTTFHYRLQGPLISFQSTLWKQQNVIMFSGCIQHYIATIYFHFICLSNTGASAGNWFRLARVSVHEKSSFSSSDLPGTLTLDNFKWIFGTTPLFSSHFVKLSHPNYFFCGSGLLEKQGDCFDLCLTSHVCFKSGNR